MFTRNSIKGKYILAGLLGAAAGALIVALATRAGPKMMSGMMHKMMAEMKECGGEAGDGCHRMMARTGHAPEDATCGS